MKIKYKKRKTLKNDGKIITYSMRIDLESNIRSNKTKKKYIKKYKKTIKMKK